jgi:hypothetical protein
MIEKIGNDAGRLWSLLNDKGTTSIKDAKKNLKLTDKEVYVAIGWLAREEKLVFNEVKEDIYLSLK